MDPVVAVPRVLLPAPGVDLARWAVVACDQYTSQPDYWADAEAFVGDAPSTLRMVLPELYLNEPDVDERIDACHAAMRAYWAAGLLVPADAFVHVERRVTDGVRNGLVVALDLDAYDFDPAATTPIRATEGTVLDRLPPRMAVRRGAEVELPHILVLYDDPDHTVLAPVHAQRDRLPVAYDVELMAGSGHLTGRLVADAATQAAVLAALDALVAPDADAPLWFAMGDGNHSLAAAKGVWEELKASGAASDHPARYALVELVNLHDASLVFEPIHRVVFDAPDLAAALPGLLGGADIAPVADAAALLAAAGAGAGVGAASDGRQRVGLVGPDGLAVATLHRPTHQLAVGSLSDALDRYLAEHPEAEIDYVHGEEVVLDLGRRPGNLGLVLPAIGKESFFRSIAVDGPLPRKTFSMGHAPDKRFYMECRRIVP